MNTEVLNITEKAYRSLPYLNASKFKAFFTSPLHYNNQKQPEETEDMRIGTAVHTMVLEPNNFHKTVAFAPMGLDRRKTADKLVWEEFVESSNGKVALKGESRAVIEGCVNAITTHTTAVNIISKCEKEQVIVSDLEGVECKGKLDLVCVKCGILADIKTTRAGADPQSFIYEMQDRRYWVQMAFYTMLAEKMYDKKFTFKFIVVEKEAPYAVAVVTISDVLMEACKKKVSLGLLSLKLCLEHDQYAGISDYNIDTLLLK
jgi:exodeoxyribonuclease VIII